MKQTLAFKGEEIKELEALKGAFSSERLRWLTGRNIPEQMDEEFYDDAVEQILVEEKIRSKILSNLREFGYGDDIKEFIIYKSGDKTIMGVDRSLLNDMIDEIKKKGSSAIKGIELIPNKLWLVLKKQPEIRVKVEKVVIKLEK